MDVYETPLTLSRNDQRRLRLRFHRQSEELSESDVDLMIVGNASLADLSPALQKAEERLAREVNPTLFLAEEFARSSSKGTIF